MVSGLEATCLIVQKSAVVTEAADDGNKDGSEKSKGVAIVVCW